MACQRVISSVRSLASEEIVLEAQHALPDVREERLQIALFLAPVPREPLSVDQQDCDIRPQERAERVDPPRRLFGASRRLLEPLPGVVVPRQPKHVERPAFHRGVVRALELELKWYVVDANLVAGGTSASSRMPT